MTLVSPGVQVTVVDESQFVSNDTRDTVPLVVIATEQDKANATATGTAPFTTQANANVPKLITSSRELIQNYGNPTFFDVNGTIQNGFELNEYGLLTAFKALNITNRVWVVRGDIDLGQLVAQSTSPSAPAPDNTYWFDVDDTLYGVFQYESGDWVLQDVTVINSTVNLNGAAPSDSFGKDGDIAVVTVSNTTTNSENRIYEKISGAWYNIGSTAWDAATPTTVIGTIGFSSASDATLSGLPDAGDTFTISAGGATTPVTLNVAVTGANNVVTANTLGLSTFVAEGSTVTFGTTTGANITGTVTHASATVATAASIGDILQITDTAGTDNVTMRIRIRGADAFPAAAGSESFEINNASVSTGSGLANAAAAAVAINAVVSSVGTSNQGISATAHLIASQTNTNYDGAGSNGTFTAGTGYAGSDTITLSDGSVITVNTETAGAVTTFTVTTVGDTGFSSTTTLTQTATSGSGTGFTLTPGQANQVLQLLKATAVSGENLADQVEVDLTSLSTAFETTPTNFPAASASAATNLNINEVVESINDQVSNTDNITASVGASNVLVITDSATGLQVANGNGVPLTDFGLAVASAVPLADIETELEAGISDLAVTPSPPTTGNPITLTFTGTGTFDITSGTSLTELGFVAGSYGVSLNSFVSQVNTATSSDPLGSVVTVGALNFVRFVDQSAGGSNNTILIGGNAATLLGLPSTTETNQLFYAPHTSVPSSPTEGDVWIKTTTPDNGADYVIRQRDDALGQWTLNETVTLQANNQDAFDEFGTGLATGSIYVQYDVDEDNTASHVFKRYNGATVLELNIATADYTQTVGNIRVGNGRASTQTVNANQNISGFVSAINNLGQANLEAEETSTGFTIRNTAGEDIVLEDDTATVLAVIGIAAGVYSNWVALADVQIGDITGYTPSAAAPTTTPDEGTLWYDADIAISEIDLLQHDGSTWTTFSGDLQLSATTPSTRADGSSALQNNDVWVDSGDLENYPVIYKWNSTTLRWVLVDNTDQTSVNGIVFQDARPDSSSQLDPDAPNPNLFPTGMLLWNTRASSFGVREFKGNWFGDGSDTSRESFSTTDFTTTTYTVGNDVLPALTTKDRWVTVSGNRTDGSPYMGRKAQRIMVVRAMAEALQVDEIRDPRNVFFNLVLAPGYPELIDEMLTLSVDRRETTFVIGDSPFRLAPDSTSLQAWATNSNSATSNGDEGLVTSDNKVAVYYPSMGLTTNVDGTEVAMPSSLGALYAYLFNDNVAYPWIPPAGLNRGTLSGVFTSVGYLTTDEEEFTVVNLNRGQQDTLYTNNVNPIVFTPGRGLYVNGQKTLSPTTSALDRVNVSRLVVFLRYQLEILAEEFLFEINDEITRDQVKDTFDRFFGDLLGLRALFDFLVVVDETNNTPERIDANELWIDIAIQPAKAIEFIFIPIRIKNTGEDLTN